MTFVAVVSDTMLHPFYPQFFSHQFGIDAPEHTGYYLAGCCLTIMIAFPFWAWVHKKYQLFDILMITQLLAGILCCSIFWVKSIELFWTLALSMIFFKGSYLLMYPFIMKIDKEENHTSSISILSVIVHFGAILGAFFGGSILDWFDVKYVFFIMAMGDFVQLFVCFYLKNNPKAIEDKAQEENVVEKNSFISDWIKPNILKVGGLTMVLYFSTFLIRPFFVEYWESTSSYESNILAGFMYSIPAFVGVVALIYSHKKGKNQQVYKLILPSILMGICGIALQGSGYVLSIIFGRMLYGWAVFQIYVQFDVIAFRNSQPKEYASDYSKIHFLQNLGVLFSSLVSGFVVDHFSLKMPFGIAIVGFIIAGVFYGWAYKNEIVRKNNQNKASMSAAV
ncbi:hypothetical protein NH26_16650 [Flammeovirga pacifica]|uniref:MFS transporter n=2 Tax=Flammeovirga pacifica TaxID=915059 RepID=A0A1S1Z3I7_FLAPC|nr:hypothetical protein NH26_16650 [Flammeovirga pacifica]